jgi:amidase
MGPLHGVPHAVKDLQPVKGIRFTQGSPILKDFIPPADSLMVERLRKAGAIIIGKTNTPEFGIGSHTYNPVYGVTRNAYDQTRSAGGSSGGAAVALALRMAPVADGSDYGGSLRNPAGWNNVVALDIGRAGVPKHTFGHRHVIFTDQRRGGGECLLGYAVRRQGHVGLRAAPKPLEHERQP